VSVSYVAGHFCKANERLAAIVDRVDNNTCPELTAVFADAPSFSLKLAVNDRLTKRFCWKPRLPINIYVEAGKMLADYFIAAVTLYAFGAAVPAYDVTRTIHHINRIFLDTLNQYCKLRCAMEHLPVSLSPLCNATRDRRRFAALTPHTLGVSRCNLRSVTPFHHRNRYGFTTSAVARPVAGHFTARTEITARPRSGVNVRFGSKADIGLPPIDVRFTLWPSTAPNVGAVRVPK
jgi:hypothetical protein